jgi:hypothetical protein
MVHSLLVMISVSSFNCGLLNPFKPKAVAIDETATGFRD